MPRQMDILKVGKRYQVYDSSVNTPISPTYSTRKEAEEEMSRLWSEDYGSEYDPMTGERRERTVTPEWGRSTVEQAEIAARKVDSST